MGSCFRCKVGFSSGLLHNGREYCTMCYTGVRQGEDAAKRREEAMKRQREDARRAAAVEITHRHAAQSAAAPAGLSGRAVAAKPKPHPKLHRHHPAAQAHPGQHQPHSPAHGIHWSGGALPVASTQAEKHVPLRRTEKEKSHARLRGSFAAPSGSSIKLLLETVSGLPSSLSLGQRSIIVILKGTSLLTKPASVTLEITISDAIGKKIPAAIEPRQCTLEAVGEGSFTIAFDVPENAALGTLKFTARLHENAFYIDPAQGKSEKLELVSLVE